MKKIFFTLAMASMVAFAACNKEDNTGENNQPEEPKEQVSRVFEDFEGEGMLSWTAADGCS